MARIHIDIKADSLLQSFADLKEVPLSKVIRNAGRDFAQASHKVTPTAKLTRSPFAKITNRQGKKQYVRIDKYSVKQQKRLNKRRVRILKGWSKASWIGVFRALGMSTKAPPKRLPIRVVTVGTTEESRGQTQASLTILDNLKFTALKGRDREIAEAGYKLASERIIKEYTRILKQAQKGQKPKP